MTTRLFSSIKTLKVQAIAIMGVLVLTVVYSLFQKKLYVLPLASQREITVKIPHFKLKNIFTSSFVTQDHFFNSERSQGSSENTVAASPIPLPTSQRPVLIHFWATWCIPCVEELPALLQFAQNPLWKDKFQFIIVATQDTEAKVRKFLDDLSTGEKALNAQQIENVSMLIDTDGTLLEQLGGYKLPETYVFTQQGHSQQFSGPQDWSGSQFLKELKAFVKN